MCCEINCIILNIIRSDELLIEVVKINLSHIFILGPYKGRDDRNK